MAFHVHSASDGLISAQHLEVTLLRASSRPSPRHYLSGVQTELKKKKEKTWTVSERSA